MSVYGEAARILNTQEAMEPQPINKLTTAAFRVLKIFGTSQFGGRKIKSFQSK